MLKVSILFLFAPGVLSYVFRFPSPKASDCSISLRALTPQPVVATYSNNPQVIYPNQPGQSTISIKENDQVYISCPKGTLTYGSSSSSVAVVAKCVGGTSFQIGSTTIDFSKNIKCSKIEDTARDVKSPSGECTGTAREEIEIGFELNQNLFLRQLLICFDQGNASALFVKEIINALTDGLQDSADRIEFRQDTFYPSIKDVNSAYLQVNQQKTINQLLGLPDTNTTYVNTNTEYFLSRGHLAAKADFIFAPQQIATFHYVNAVPQWQVFNGGNWDIIERSVRQYAKSLRRDLTVYTGTFNITSLNNSQGKATKLYLYTTATPNLLPVPHLFWKLVYDPVEKKAVVIISKNNPYDQSRSQICNSVTRPPWLLTAKWDDHGLGFTYFCSLDTFGAKVEHAPKLDVSGGVLV